MKLKLRFRDRDPNHHLWSNHDIWYVAYTVETPQGGTYRIRRSLGTKDVGLARVRRDSIFQKYCEEEPLHRASRLPIEPFAPAEFSIPVRSMGGNGCAVLSPIPVAALRRLSATRG
jgi:hypothetical protein